MIARKNRTGYTESLSKTKAVIPPRQSAAFFMPACRQSYPSLVGVENSHTTPARGKLYAASFVPRVRPTARIEGGLSQKTKEVSMTALAFRDVTFDVRTIRNTIYITSAQLAQALGYSREDAVGRIYERNADEFTSDMSQTVKLTVSGNYQKTVRLFSLRGCHLVAMFSRTPVAKEFRKWVLDILDKETGTLAPAQQQAIQSAVAARCGRDSRSYRSVYTALKARFQVARYDQIPASQFNEAIRYIETVNISSSVPALPSTVNLLDKDYFAKVRDISIKFCEDWIRVGKGEDVTPSLTIPDEVLAGIVAQQLSRQPLLLYINCAGNLSVDVIPNKSPYEDLAKYIEDKTNTGLSDETIHEIGQACINALAYRSKARKSSTTNIRKRPSLAELL